MASLVVRVTPPSVPADGDVRIYEFRSRDNSNIRVLSPRIEPIIHHDKKIILILQFDIPPVVEDDGSTVNTATLCP